MSFNPIVLLEKAINEHGSSVILKERLSLVADKLQTVEAENHAFKATNQELIEEIKRLRYELESKTVPDDFIPHRGALFRRDSSGNIESVVYCRVCKSPMSSLGKLMPYSCHCNKFKADFNGQDLSGIINEIK